MKSNPVFDSIRQLVFEGETGQALQELVAFLEKEGAQPEILRDLHIQAAEYNSTQRKVNNNLLTRAEGRAEDAKTNQTILIILEELASGQPPRPRISGTGDGRIRYPALPWIIGLVVLVLLGILGGIWYNSKKETPAVIQTVVPAKKAEPQCPDFRPEGFKVMIVQFQNLRGEGKSKPELSIQDRIRKLTSENKLATDVEILNDQKFENTTPDLTDATDLGKNCMADLVIWGQFEPMQNDAISMDIHYAFTDERWPPGAASQTFKNLSEIKADYLQIDNFDDAVFRICTALAVRKNRQDLVKKWLNKIQKPTAVEESWKRKL